MNSLTNHSSRLKEFFKKSDNVILVSPFLMTDFSGFLAEIELVETKKIHLITTLKPNSVDQIPKIKSLVSLIEFSDIHEDKIKCNISLNNRLHGKVYIFKNGESYLSAIISSANLTFSGLSRNHEWGVEITSKHQIQELENSILEGIEFENISFQEIYKMQDKANQYLQEKPLSEISKIELDLTTCISPSYNSSFLNENVNYWLKPIGDVSRPIEKDRLFNENEGVFGFSKLRPSGVKQNDILIIYGVGSGKIISIYRVDSPPELATNDQINENVRTARWPWSIRGINLTPIFGGAWWTHNLHINSLREQYLSVNINGSITFVGGKTLGALNFGKDKVKLAPGFARYLIDHVYRQMKTSSY